MDYLCYNDFVFAALCNGSTTDSDSVCLGSNPSAAAKLWINFRFAHVFLFLCVQFLFDYTKEKAKPQIAKKEMCTDETQPVEIIEMDELFVYTKAKK